MLLAANGKKNLRFREKSFLNAWALNSTCTCNQLKVELKFRLNICSIELFCMFTMKNAIFF